MKSVNRIRKYGFYFWTATGFFLLYTFSESFAYPDTIVERTINSIFLVSYTAVVNYIFFEIAFPLFKPDVKKIILALLLTGVLGFFYTFGLYGWRHFWIYLNCYTDLTPGLTFVQGVITHSRFSLASVIFFGIVRHLHNYNNLRISAKQLRIEKQEAELNYLKSQTNPHFLFNTLNNIYSLARDKSDLAPESILRLSKILRFMLYETNGEFIPIAREVKVIEDYIALEKLRYDESLKIEFTHSEEECTQPIPPLLLIPLVENAFKHGVSETRNNPFINIELLVQQQTVNFIVRNSVGEMPEQEGIKENIGLSNLRRQLMLLYTESYLSAKYENFEFIAVLKINLASYVKN